MQGDRCLGPSPITIYFIYAEIETKAERFEMGLFSKKDRPETDRPKQEYGETPYVDQQLAEVNRLDRQITHATLLWQRSKGAERTSANYTKLILEDKKAKLIREMMDQGIIPVWDERLGWVQYGRE